jgi:hypothetical protein
LCWMQRLSPSMVPTPAPRTRRTNADPTRSGTRSWTSLGWSTTTATESTCRCRALPHV